MKRISDFISSEIPNSSDCISRQAAIAVADRADYTGLAVENVKKVTDEVIKELKQLPSVQPEIIRCKDCKHWYKDADSGMSCEYTEMSQPEDGFCNWAELRGE